MTFLVLTVISALFPLTEELKFQHLSTDDGLSQSTIYAIEKDSSGFIWIATEDGLNRYDGYNFKIYRERRGDTTAIANNIIFSLAVDRRGILWAGTLSGLSRFDARSEKFFTFRASGNDSSGIPSNDIRSLFVDSRDRLWIGTTAGLCYLDIGRERIHRIPLLNSKSGTILSIAEDSSGKIWFGSLNGVYYFDPEATDGSVYKLHRNVGHYVYALGFIDQTLIAGSNQGLSLVDIDTWKRESFSSASSDEGLSDLTVYRLVIESDSIIWLGTMGGVNRFHRNRGTFLHIRHDAARTYSLSDDRIFSLYLEKNPAGNALWAGTMNGGINILDYKRLRFPHYRHNPGIKNSLPGDHVAATLEDHQGNLWIGTFEGLIRINPQSGTMHSIRMGTDKYLQNEIHSLKESINGDIWVGTFGGLFQLHPNGMVKNHFWAEPTDTTRLSNNLIEAIEEDHNGFIWVGTKAGLNRYSPKENRFRRFPLIKDKGPPIGLQSISALLVDSRKNVWAGSIAGLFRFDRLSERFIPEPVIELQEEYITSLFEDADHFIWVGTKNGLYKTKNNQVAGYYSAQNGLPNGFITGILQADDGTIWISTYDGLARLDQQTDDFTIFKKKDGLQNNAFSPARYKLSDGILLFGGSRGFNLIDPSQIELNQENAPIVITRISHMNHETGESADPEFLQNLTLKHDHGFLEIEFSLLDFTNPAGNRYRYKLDGFDDNWINVDSRRFARYTKLPTGKYLFRIRSANSDGIWSACEKTLSVHVEPPLWETAWFRGFAMLLALSLLTLLVHYRVKTKSRRAVVLERIRQTENERIRKKTAQDFHDGLGHKLAKINLLSQTAHTLYAGQTTGLTPHLQSIQEIASSMHTDMHNLLWMLDPGKDTLFDIIVKLKDFGEELFDKSGISFHSAEIPGILGSYRIPFDHKTHLLLLFQEVFSNSLKHSGAHDVFFECAVSGAHLCITAGDTGSGIPTDKNIQGYGLTNIKERASALNADLEMNSESGSGTHYRLILELPDQAGANDVDDA